MSYTIIKQYAREKECKRITEKVLSIVIRVESSF